MHNLVTIIAKDFIIIPPLILAFVLFRLPRDQKLSAANLVILAALLTVTFAEIGSSLFNDPRPFVAGHFTPYFPHGNDNGFPSDHTLLAGLVAALTYVFNKRLGAIAFTVAILIGAARVIAGVHHIADIIGALVIASLGTLIAELMVRRSLKKSDADH